MDKLNQDELRCYLNDSIRTEYLIAIAKLKSAYFTMTGEELKNDTISDNIYEVHRVIMYGDSLTNLIMYLNNSFIEKKAKRKKEVARTATIMLPYSKVGYSMPIEGVNPDNFLKTEQAVREHELITYEMYGQVYEGYVISEEESYYRVMSIKNMLNFIDTPDSSAYDILKDAKMLLTVPKDCVLQTPTDNE